MGFRTMSADLTWMILRNQSKFLVKRNGIALSSGPGNLKNKHSFKYSTLANSKAIGLERAEDGAVLSTKLKTKKSPKGMFKKVTLKRLPPRCQEYQGRMCFVPPGPREGCSRAVDSDSPQPRREEEIRPGQEVSPWQQVSYCSVSD